MRNYPDWLQAFKEYCMNGEAPERMLFWVGVSAVAGALQRKVWFSMGKFKWYPNFYIVLVAPPGVVAKSTTTSYAMELLRPVPGVKFCPSTITWQALVARFNKDEMKATHTVPLIDPATGEIKSGENITYSAMTLFSSELGTLISNNDRDMLDALTQLYDCNSFEKETLKDGVMSVESPFLNIVACTTPEWISSNFSAYSIGSGLMSRMLMVYAKEKRQYVAYPGLTVEGAEDKERREKLIHDLKEIAEMKGEFPLTTEAWEWGDWWYKEFHTKLKKLLGDSRADGYAARKQAHAHKLALVLAASRGERRITRGFLQEAVELLSDLEKDMPMLFDFMGKTRDANQADRIVEFVRANPGTTIKAVYRHVHNYFPKQADFDEVMKGLLKSGLLSNAPVGLKMGLVVTEMPDGAGGSPIHAQK